MDHHAFTVAECGEMHMRQGTGNTREPAAGNRVHPATGRGGDYSGLGLVKVGLVKVGLV
jgi:hypothetical protein